MEPATTQTVFEPLNCMEIWGGIEPIEMRRATPGLEIWIYSCPYQGAEGGGDLHYVTLCGGGQVTRVAVADVSGHGERVAEFASMLRALLRKHINKKCQRQLVGWLNRRFSEEVRLGLFATAVIATYVTSTDELTVCNAGHPRPLLFHAAEERWAFLSGDELGSTCGAINLPLGIDSGTRYDQVRVGLGRDDVIVFYTDALIEAVNDQGEMLGEDGLLKLAKRLPVTDHDPWRIGTTLRDSVSAYRGDRPPDDDLTLVVLRHTATEPTRLSLAEKLDVYAKFFGLKSI